MDGERQAGPATEPGQAVEAARVIEVPVAEHHALQVAEAQAETFGVDGQAVRGDPGVEQQHRLGAAATHGDQGGKAVLSAQPGYRAPGFELRGRHRPGRWRRPGDAFGGGEQGVEEVVDQGRDRDLVDGEQPDGIRHGSFRGPGGGHGRRGGISRFVTHVADRSRPDNV